MLPKYPSFVSVPMIKHHDQKQKQPEDKGMYWAHTAWSHSAIEGRQAGTQAGAGTGTGGVLLSGLSRDSTTHSGPDPPASTRNEVCHRHAKDQTDGSNSLDEVPFS